jgi:hypothetical protein
MSLEGGEQKFNAIIKVNDVQNGLRWMAYWLG